MRDFPVGLVPIAIVVIFLLVVLVLPWERMLGRPPRSDDPKKRNEP